MFRACGRQETAAPEVLIGLQEVREGDLVDDRASGAIDERGILLHHVQSVLVQQMICLLAQITVQTDNLRCELNFRSLTPLMHMAHGISSGCTLHAKVPA